MGGVYSQETSKPWLNHENKRGIYQVDDNIDIKASLARLHRGFDISIKRDVNATNEVENQPTPCHICLSYDHHVERCSIPTMRETLEG